MDFKGFRGWHVDVSFRYTGNTDFDDLVYEVIERIKKSYGLTSEDVIDFGISRVGFIGLRAEPLINAEKTFLQFFVFSGSEIQRTSMNF